MIHLSNIDILGYIAAIFTTCSFVPQALKVIKTKNTNGISLIMYIMFVVGVSLWLVYGVLAKQYSVALANGITLIFSSLILYYKVLSIVKRK